MAATCGFNSLFVDLHSCSIQATRVSYSPFPDYIFLNDGVTLVSKRDLLGENNSQREGSTL